MSNEQYVTTAATAELEASTAKLAKEVEVNAEAEKHAAADAAAAAKVRQARSARHETDIYETLGEGTILHWRFHRCGQIERDH